MLQAATWRTYEGYVLRDNEMRALRTHVGQTMEKRGPYGGSPRPSRGTCDSAWAHDRLIVSPARPRSRGQASSACETGATGMHSPGERSRCSTALGAGMGTRGSLGIGTPLATGTTELRSTSPSSPPRARLSVPPTPSSPSGWPGSRMSHHRSEHAISEVMPPSRSAPRAALNSAAASQVGPAGEVTLPPSTPCNGHAYSQNLLSARQMSARADMDSRASRGRRSNSAASPNAAKSLGRSPGRSPGRPSPSSRTARGKVATLPILDMGQIGLDMSVSSPDKAQGSTWVYYDMLA